MFLVQGLVEAFRKKQKKDVSNLPSLMSIGWNWFWMDIQVAQFLMISLRCAWMDSKWSILIVWIHSSHSRIIFFDRPLLTNLSPSNIQWASHHVGPHYTSFWGLVLLSCFGLLSSMSCASACASPRPRKRRPGIRYDTAHPQTGPPRIPPNFGAWPVRGSRGWMFSPCTCTVRSHRISRVRIHTSLHHIYIQFQLKQHWSIVSSNHSIWKLCQGKNQSIK